MALAIGNIGQQADAVIIRPSNRQQFVFLDRLQRGQPHFDTTRRETAFEDHA